MKTERFFNDHGISWPCGNEHQTLETLMIFHQFLWPPSCLHFQLGGPESSMLGTHHNGGHPDIDIHQHL